MIKRTPQEIADFFGCYVFQSHVTGCWVLCGEKVEWRKDAWHWKAGALLVDFPSCLVGVPAVHDWTRLYEPKAKDPIEVFRGIQAKIHEPGNITPKSGNINEESGKNCQKSDLYPYLPDSDISAKSYCPDSKDSGSKDSAPHQSQVHTHQEYHVAFNMMLASLCDHVNKLMAEGWKPQGGIASWIGENGFRIYYQAMTRGIA